MLNRQDVFDAVVEFYRNGGLPGHNGSQCAYIGEDGGRCAVGVLFDKLGVSDSDIDHDNEDGISDIMQRENDPCAIAVREACDRSVWYDPMPENMKSKSFLERLQGAHDSIAETEFGGAYDEDGYVDEDRNWPDDIQDMLLDSFQGFAQKEGLEYK